MEICGGKTGALATGGWTVGGSAMVNGVPHRVHFVRLPIRLRRSVKTVLQFGQGTSMSMGLPPGICCGRYIHYRHSRIGLATRQWNRVAPPQSE